MLHVVGPGDDVMQISLTYWVISYMFTLISKVHLTKEKHGIIIVYNCGVCKMLQTTY